jgi:hypothetical protein
MSEAPKLKEESTPTADNEEVEELEDEQVEEGNGVVTSGSSDSPAYAPSPLTSFVDEGKKKKKKKKAKKKKLEQSDPPRIGLSKFFTEGIYPEGEIQRYKDE